MLNAREAGTRVVQTKKVQGVFEQVISASKGPIVIHDLLLDDEGARTLVANFNHIFKYLQVRGGLTTARPLAPSGFAD